MIADRWKRLELARGCLLQRISLLRRPSPSFLLSNMFTLAATERRSVQADCRGRTDSSSALMVRVQILAWQQPIPPVLAPKAGARVLMLNRLPDNLVVEARHISRRPRTIAVDVLGQSDIDHAIAGVDRIDHLEDRHVVSTSV